MRIEVTQHGWDDFVFWIENDPDFAARIKELIQSLRVRNWVTGTLEILLKRVLVHKNNQRTQINLSIQREKES